jgi:hypothetical protein
MILKGQVYCSAPTVAAAVRVRIHHLKSLLLLLLLIQDASSFGISKPATSHQQSVLHTAKIDVAWSVIDECAETGEPCDELFQAVRFLETNAYIIYPDLSHKQDLWDKAHGSFKLVLSTGSAKNRSFHKPPFFLPFSFAMIDDEHFGNGVGLNQDVIWLSLLHKHYYNTRIRHMVVTIQDVFLGGKRVTNSLPQSLLDSLNVGKAPEDFDKPPTFVIIGASDKALIARGNQSGGLAIWSRLENDIRKVAYKQQ